jgi:hypothetical protein
MDNLKSICLLWACLADHFCITHRDISTFKRRVCCEGYKFLLDDMTQLGRSLDKSLVTGKPFQIMGRFKCQNNSVLPVFLGDLFAKIFDKTGKLLNNNDPHYIKVARQLLLLCYKMEVPYEEDTLNDAITSFVNRDSNLCSPIPMGVHSVPRSNDLGTVAKTARRAASLIQRVLQQCSPRDIRPRHGSGATSCSTPNHDKYHSFRYIETLNRVFPYNEYFFFNPTHFCDALDAYLECDEVEVPCSKLVAVPKDRRGPRLICCEPREHQYIQQGLMRNLYKCIESHPLTSGFVNFTNQDINKEIARQSSSDLRHCTIDLRDASDRVRLDVVERLFPGNWVEAFKACRTTMVKLPDGSIFGPLRKFAPMGSAVCFPVEALVFWAILKASLNCDVYVYGDDIIVPTDLFTQAVHTLESFDLSVNVDKSCAFTHFRESCGGDYYCGYDVSYVKLRTEVRSTVNSEISLVEFANLIRVHYGELAASRIRTIIDGLFGPHYIGRCAYGLNYIGEPRSSNDVFFRRRWNRDLQINEYLLPVGVTTSLPRRTSAPYHWGEMLRRELEGDHDHFNLGHYATPGCTKKYRWRAA